MARDHETILSIKEPGATCEFPLLLFAEHSKLTSNKSKHFNESLIITNIVFLIIFKDTIDVYIKYR